MAFRGDNLNDQFDNDLRVLGTLTAKKFKGDGSELSGISTTETDPVFTAWDKDYGDLINTPNLGVYWKSDGSASASGNWTLGAYTFTATDLKTSTRLLFNNTNVGIGTDANYSGGIYNVAIGHSTLRVNSSGGNYNFALGADALYNNTNQPYNTAIGAGALFTSTGGTFNVAIGLNSMRVSTTGDYNVGLGGGSLRDNTTGSYNMAFGGNALYSNTTGRSNVAMGMNSGLYIADGTTPVTLINYSLLLGEDTKPLNNDDTNEIVIGYNATGAGSNSVVLGNDSITSTILKGDVKITGNLTDGTNSLTVANAKTAYDHSQDNTQAHSDYLLNSAADAGVGLTLSGDNSSADTAYVPMVLYNTDATPPTASGFPVGTIYVQYTA